MNIPMPQTPEEVRQLIGLECPKCLEMKYDKADHEWILQFKECLRCDHLHNEEIEEATHE